MFCLNCGTENAQTIRFCSRCGTNLDDVRQALLAPRPSQPLAPLGSDHIKLILRAVAAISILTPAVIFAAIITIFGIANAGSSRYSPGDIVPLVLFLALGGLAAVTIIVVRLLRM